jgi:hypothetical protein
MIIVGVVATSMIATALPLTTATSIAALSAATIATAIAATARVVAAALAATRRVAATVAATRRVAATVAATATAREVDRGTPAKAILRFMQIMTMLIGEEMGIKLIQCDVDLDGEGGDEGVVVVAESSEDVRDDLIFTQWLADGSERVGQRLHLAKVVCRRCSLLLAGSKLGTRLNRTRPCP